MIALLLVLAATTAQSPHYDKRMLGVGGPRMANKVAAIARACGYVVTVRPYADGDITPKPKSVAVGSLIVLANKPIDPNGREMKCLLPQEANLFRATKR